jgi:hypothetical protein
MLPAALLGGKGERRGERRLLGDRGGEVWRSLMLGLAGCGQSGVGGAAVGRRWGCRTSVVVVDCMVFHVVFVIGFFFLKR